VFEDIGRTIDEEQGIKNLTIERFYDENKLDEWPLRQLVLKTYHLESLKIAYLIGTTVANRSELLEFASQAVTNSSCLHKLHIEFICTSKEEGDDFLQALADDHFDGLQSLTIR